MKKRQLLYFLMLAFIINYQISNAQQIHDFDSLYKNDKEFKNNFKATSDSKDLFDSDEVLKISIESDFKNLVKTKNSQPY
jgi:hypothetical protein